MWVVANLDFGFSYDFAIIVNLKIWHQARIRHHRPSYPYSWRKPDYCSCWHLIGPNLYSRTRRQFTSSHTFNFNDDYSTELSYSSPLTTKRSAVRT